MRSRKCVWPRRPSLFLWPRPGIQQRRPKSHLKTLQRWDLLISFLTITLLHRPNAPESALSNLFIPPSDPTQWKGRRTSDGLFISRFIGRTEGANKSLFQSFFGCSGQSVDLSFWPFLSAHKKFCSLSRKQSPWKQAAREKTYFA